MNFIKKNKYTIIVIILLSLLMFYFIGQKNGFHEDEIFSYGSSNYKYDNVYRSYGYATAKQDVLYNEVLKGSFINQISNLKTFITNPDSYVQDEVLQKMQPTFRPKEEALKYLVVDKSNVFNYFSVYYNQAADVHPPLFYFCVHFLSSLNPGHFSKYIIFSLNLVFFIGSLIIICKIMKEIKKEKLTIPALILYGASTGAISTVMFQRMYMMLTFFCLLYLYLTFKFVNNNFEITNKKLWFITIICGFLTQYYFCFYIVLVFILISIYLLFNKEYKKLFNYFIIHAISALIGIVLFPSSIYHIFFSYRGIGATDGHVLSYIQTLIYFIDQILLLFNLKNIYIIVSALLIIYFWKNKIPKIKEKDIFNLLVLTIPTLFYILLVSKTSPFLGRYYTSRYIMLTFPIIAIIIIYTISLIFEKKALLVALIFSLVLSVNGLINNNPIYLYKSYDKVMDFAKENQDKYFVYVYDNEFTHLNSILEFATYKESIILNNYTNDFNLLNNDKINSSDEFVLCIKAWLNNDEILKKVLNSTQYKSYEKVLEIEEDICSAYYIIKKK